MKLRVGKPAFMLPAFRVDPFPILDESDQEVAYCRSESDAREIVARWNAHPTAVRLLKEFADHFTGPCELDHHGNCQAHMLEEKCSVKEARELLAACGKEQSNG